MKLANQIPLAVAFGGFASLLGFCVGHTVGLQHRPMERAAPILVWTEPPSSLIREATDARDQALAERDSALAELQKARKAHAAHLESHGMPECTSMWWREQLAAGRWAHVTCDPLVPGVVFRDGEPVVRP